MNTQNTITHFTRNFELSGFGSPGEALVQTVKELVDNAVDACRLRSVQQDAPMVRVTLRRPHHEYLPGKQDDITRKEEGPLELQVVDNGTGLTDILGSLALFSSTKSGSESTRDALAGKYGLGLTLSLLYSQVHFGGVVKITSAAEDSLHWSLMKCRVDPGTGEPITEFSKTGDKPKGFRSGSDIRLWVPGSMKALAYAKPRLEVLFRRMKLTADRAAGVNFICEGCLDELSISVSHGGSENSPQLLEDNLDLVRSFSSGLTAMLREEADNDCRKDLATDLLHIDGHAMPVAQHGAREVLPEDAAIFECEGGKAGMYVQVAVALQRTLRGVGSVQGGREGREALTTIPAPGLAPPSSPAPASVPLFLSRFVNRVPMLDTPTSSACALCAGVAGAPWRRLGLSLSSSKIREEEGRLRFILSETPTPLKDYALVTTTALEAALFSLLGREAGGFHSAKDFAAEMLFEELIPLASSCVASMVVESNDTTFQKACLEALDVGSEYMQHGRLKHVLQRKLTENTIAAEQALARAAKEAFAQVADQDRNGMNARQQARKVFWPLMTYVC